MRRFTMHTFAQIMAAAAATLLVGGVVLAQPLADYRIEEGPPEATSTADAQAGTAANFNGAMNVANWVNHFLAPVPGGTTQALRFNDAAPDFLNVPGFTGVTGTASRTISAWINTREANGAIVSWGNNAAGQKWTFRTQTTNGLAGALRTEVNGGYVVGDTVINDGRWHHVAVTWADDGTPDITDANLYVDGVLQTFSATNTQTINTASSADVRIAQDFSNRALEGAIDQVRIYDSALSAAQIAALAGPGPIPPTPLLNYDAARDTTPANGTWEESLQIHNPGQFDADVSGGGITYDPAPTSVFLGINAAYSFDGTSGAELGTFEGVTGNLTDESASFEIWFKPSDFASQSILAEFGGTTDGSSLSLDGSTLQLVAKDNAASTAVSADLSGLPADEFIQAVGVFDLVNGDLSLYVNGLLEDDAAFTGGDWAGADGGAFGGVANAIGGGGGALGDFAGFGNFVGDIAIARLFSGALTDQEVADLFQLVAVPEPSSILIWSLIGIFGAAVVARRYRAKK